MISSVAGLIATAYVLYITVFEQIISQNQGYFYAVVFGFILLVMFLLCNLFTKLLAISTGKQNTSYRKVIIVIALAGIVAFFLGSRMRYSTQLYAGDSYTYKGAMGLIDGSYSQSGDIVEDALINPSHFLYSFVLSVVFRIAEPGSGPILWTNAFFIAVTALLTYRIVRRFTNQMCGLFAAFLSVIIPSQTFAVYSFSSEPMVAAIFQAAALSLISLFSYNKRIKEKYGSAGAGEDRRDYAGVLFCISGALFIGLLIFVEPFMIIPMLLLVLVGYLTHTSKALSMLVSLAGGIVVMVLLCFVKSTATGAGFEAVMTSEMSAFDPNTNRNSGEVYDFSDVYHSFNVSLSSTNDNVVDNYLFLEDAEGESAYTEMGASWVVVLNQMMYMFILMMSISCIILAMKEQKDYVVVINMLIIGAVVMLLFQQNRIDQKFLFISVFIIATSTGIHYLYLDHHPELKVDINALNALEKTGRKDIAAATRENLKNAAQMNEEDFVKRANALIFVGNDEDLYHQIKADEHRKASGYTGNTNIVEDAFDDYDEDFFLDKEDNVDDSEVTVTTVAPSGIRQTVGDAYVPNAEMHESASEAYNNTSVPAWKRPERFGDEEMFDEDDVELGKAHSAFDGRETLVASAPVTTKEPEPEVVKISRKKRAKKETVAPSEPLPNPLPVPKKKEHKPIDYDNEVTDTDDDWDYDYDVDEESEWDV